MLIGIEVSYLRSVLFYSICLNIDSRQGCTTSSSEWNISIQKSDWKTKEKQNQLFMTSKIIVFPEEKQIASNLLPIYTQFHQIYLFSI
jgi:predicted NAD-dependent protein-ADP-ribosyltransferase YbiA (DUF1768 family)